jgi:hypothetical protein
VELCRSNTVLLTGFKSTLLALANFFLGGGQGYYWGAYSALSHASRLLAGAIETRVLPDHSVDSLCKNRYIIIWWFELSH